MEGLGVFRRRWSQDRDVLFAGGAASILTEIDDLARECRLSRTDAEARLALKGYIRDKK